MKQDMLDDPANRSMDDIPLDDESDENDDYYMETFDNGYITQRGNEESLDSSKFRDTMLPEPIGMEDIVDLKFDIHCEPS